MRSFIPFAIAAAAVLSAACGPTVLVEGEVDGDGSSGGTGAASSSGGTGAASSGGTGAASSGGTGAAGSGAGAGSGSGSSGSASSGGAGKQEWAKAIGSSGHQHLHGLGADQAGNVIAAGTFDGSIDLGSGPLPQKGARSGFVVKLDAKGHALWGTTLSGDDCSVEAIAVGGADEIFATGLVKGALAVGSQPVPGGDGIFVVKLDADGHLLWAETFGSSANMEADRGLSASATGTGGVLVSGSYLGALNLGAGALPAAGGVFAAAFDAQGSTLWSASFPGTSAFVTRLPDAMSGDAAVVAINEAGGTLRAKRLSPAGAPVWDRSFGAGIFTAIRDDGADGLLLAGSTKSADFGGGKLPSPLPNGEGFLVALDGDGNHRFTRGLPYDTFQSTAAALGLDGKGHAAVTGSYVVHVGGSSTVIQSAFVARFDQQGNKLGEATFGPLDAGTTQEGWGLAPAPAGGLYLGGDFYAAISVAGQTLTGSGNADVFVARLAP